MGKQQSKALIVPPSVLQGKSKEFQHAMSPKQLASVQKTILKQYPFLENVFESMLVTDNTLPDCPIVFANDQFERMTLYPKEEIIGRNCRFLQGVHTNPNTIKQIKNAVVNGLPLDIELLNYRKDGVPFMNCFLMLPIHKKANIKGKVTHFIAIQKDVTLLKGNDYKNPEEWCPSEVSMWLDRWGLIEEARKILIADIDGNQLLQLTDERLEEIGILKSMARRSVLEKVTQLKASPTTAYAGKSNLSSTYKPPEDGDVAVGSRNWWRQVSEGSLASSGKNNQDKVAVKVYHPDGIFIELIAPELKFKRFVLQVQERLQSRCSLSFYDPEGELHRLAGEDDWNTALMLATDQILSVNAKLKNPKVPKADFELLDRLPASVLMVTANHTKVLFVSRQFEETFGIKHSTVAGSPLCNLIPSLNESNLTVSFGSWEMREVLHKDGHPVSMVCAVSRGRDFCILITIVPRV